MHGPYLPKTSPTYNARFSTARCSPDAMNTELAVHMGWKMNRFTGPVGEFRKMGLVLHAGKRPCQVTEGMSRCRRTEHSALTPA